MTWIYPVVEKYWKEKIKDIFKKYKFYIIGAIALIILILLIWPSSPERPIKKDAEKAILEYYDNLNNNELEQNYKRELYYYMSKNDKNLNTEFNFDDYSFKMSNVFLAGNFSDVTIMSFLPETDKTVAQAIIKFKVT